jgi:hypothetical protein
MVRSQEWGWKVFEFLGKGFGEGVDEAAEGEDVVWGVDAKVRADN